MAKSRRKSDLLIRATFLIVSTLLTGIVSLAQSGIGRPEPHPPDWVNSTAYQNEVVNRAYLKLMLYNNASNRSIVSRNRIYNPQSDDLQVRVSNIHTGPIAEILHRKYYDLITMPSGETITLTPHIKTVNESKQEYVGYDARWQPGAVIVPEDLTIEEFLRMGGPAYADVGMYTTYDVTVGLQGRQTHYKAMAFYHSPPESNYEAKAEIFDLVMGLGGTMTRVLYEKRPAIGAVRRSAPGERKSGDIGRRVRSIDNDYGERQLEVSDESIDAPADAAAIDPLPFERPGDGLMLGYYGDSRNRSDTLCDSSGICCPAGSSSLVDCCVHPEYTWLYDFFPQCTYGGGGGGGGGGSGGSGGGGGIDPAYAACKEETRYANPSHKYDSDSSGHVWGEHYGTSFMQSYCRISTNCSATCDTDFMYVGSGDQGLLWANFLPSSSFEHAIPMIEKRSAVATGYVNGSNTPPTCSAIVAFEFKTCLLGVFCNSSLSIGGGPYGLSATVSSNAVWLYHHSTTHTCEKM